MAQPDVRSDPDWAVPNLSAAGGFAGGQSPGRSPEAMTRDLAIALSAGFLISWGIGGFSPQAIAFLVGLGLVSTAQLVSKQIGYPFLSAWASLLGCFGVVVYVSFTGYGPAAPAAISLPMIVIMSFFVGGRAFGNVITFLAMCTVGALLALHRTGHVFPRVVTDGRHGTIQLMTLGLLVVLAWLFFWSIDRAWRAAREQYVHHVSALAVTHSQMEQARDEALEANHSKSRFLASMSHELRTPLNAIIGYSELILEDEPDAEEAAEDIERIRASAIHLLALVSDVLDMSKVEAEVIDVQLISFDLSELAQNAKQRLEPLAPARVTWQLDCAKTITVFADAARTRQILDNLLTNAVRHATSQVWLEVAEDENGPLLTVRDDGEGMDDTMMLRCFLAFEKGEKSVGGTGLGLAISHRLATLMKGDLIVQSPPGQGATFTLRLPAP